eukprot:TRINITY_DN2027_c1_g1_i3.p1 TRINITY_DN2027_c1_g1~~TRINITY_DN2027_c1_g1_i3.p1  ORF type:complete len:185 (+),score=34.11 TRINITY_DN2027_c1_g1_i3:174-728(+)
MLIKLVKSNSKDEFLGVVFLYVKVSLLYLSYHCSFSLFFGYLVIFITLWISFPQPGYEGETAFVYMTPLEFSKRIITGEKEYWVVEAYATWCPPCRQLASNFAGLSLKYNSEKIGFAKIDVGRHQEFADEHQISTKGTTKQLPTLILFHHGEEVDRMPRIKPNLDVETPKWTEKALKSRLKLLQ